MFLLSCLSFIFLYSMMKLKEQGLRYESHASNSTTLGDQKLTHNIT